MGTTQYLAWLWKISFPVSICALGSLAFVCRKSWMDCPCKEPRDGASLLAAQATSVVPTVGSVLAVPMKFAL